jgi:hypothetical protein
VHSWLLVAGVTGKGVSVLPIAAGAYALAWSVGFVLIPFPGGVGPRELAFIAALAPVMPRGSAIVVAVVSRLVLTIGDLVWAAVALGLGRGGQRGAQGVARDGAPATGTTAGPRDAAPATATGTTAGARDGGTATGTTAGARDGGTAQAGNGAAAPAEDSASAPAGNSAAPPAEDSARR